MDSTLVLTGIFPFILITAGILSLIVSLLLLSLYRRATLRGMASTAIPTTGTSAGERVPSPPQDSPHRTQLPPLQFHEIDARQTGNRKDSRDAVDSAVVAFIRRAHINDALTCLAAGVAYALIMTLAWSLLASGPSSIGRSLMLMTLYLWPGVIAICLVSTIGWKESLTVLAGYLLLLMLTVQIVLSRNPQLSAAALLQLWFIINLPPSVFFLFFLQNRIRAVGPLVLAFMLCGVAGAVLLVQVTGGSDAMLGLIIRATMPMGLGATSVFILMHLAGFVLLAIVGWRLLRRLGEAYRRKRFSDRSTTLASLWLMFALIQSIGFAFEGALWILSAPIAFLACRFVVKIGQRMNSSRNRPTAEPLELLLLRVFSLGRRSNRFFDSFSRLWRPVGIINMIAGPDLVTSTVEPHEFLEFAGGKLSRRFVVSEPDLQQRLHDLDRAADPDGRYRVHEFFCHDDTWRMTMQRLAAESHAIVMDLRSFSNANQGCLYELKVLLDTIDLRHIVFIVDGTTDRAFLESSLLNLWSVLDQQSPNTDLGEPTVTLFAAENHSRRALNSLISQLTRHTLPVPDTATLWDRTTPGRTHHP
ncbi:MAG: hypothetical protein HKN42_10515 [Granulosicoccus sp.]|nr:hypothetical protein [Granulosicoccus sp.]